MSDQSPQNTDAFNIPGSPAVETATAAHPPLTSTEPPAEDAPEVIEYLLVTDKTTEVLKSGTGPEGLSACRKLAGVIRRANGEVTIFRSLKF